MNKFLNLNIFYKLTISSLCFYCLNACADLSGGKHLPQLPDKSLAINMKPVVVKLREANYPNFSDDLNFSDLDLAIQRQLDSYKRWPLRGTLELDKDKYSLSVLKDSAIHFRKILAVYLVCKKNSTTAICIKNLNTKIKTDFNIYEPNNNTAGTKTKVHYTAYYSPILKASLTKSLNYPYGIYQKPKNDNLRRSTREQILFEGALENLGLNLFYVQDLFDLYILHVEGGGVVEINGKHQNISYQGHNSNKFNFISKYMRSNGMITGSSVKEQKEYLEKHPEVWRDVYTSCPGFIYFQKTTTTPLGMENIPLTDHRSLAQDKKYFPRKGLLSYVMFKKPVKQLNNSYKLVPYSRFYVDQDTGSAIRGIARADLYFGIGDEAGKKSETINSSGSIIYLVKKPII
jgi:membrane-bound lytic murein transglycosylase A